MASSQLYAYWQLFQSRSSIKNCFRELQPIRLFRSNTDSRYWDTKPGSPVVRALPGVIWYIRLVPLDPLVWAAAVASQAQLSRADHASFDEHAKLRRVAYCAFGAFFSDQEIPDQTVGIGACAKSSDSALALWNYECEFNPRTDGGADIRPTPRRFFVAGGKNAARSAAKFDMSFLHPFYT